MPVKRARVCVCVRVADILGPLAPLVLGARSVGRPGSSRAQGGAPAPA